jgi:putative ATP-binding cassette transporter
LLIYLPLLVWLSPKYAFGVLYFPGWLAVIALVYSLGGSIISHVIGKRLILVGFAKQRFEADFRHSLVQVRDHSESVALYNSEVCEDGRLANRFVYCKRIWWEQMIYVKLLGFFQSFYSVTGFLFPIFVLAPNYFAGQITLGSMMQCLMAFNNVKSAFDWFINTYVPLMDYRATIDRLTIFLGKIESKLESSSMVKKLENPPSGTDSSVAVVARDLCVDLPPVFLADEEKEPGRNIWKGANLTIHHGTFVLLTAPEGTGKSCFFRAIAGLWPHAKGETWFQGDALFLPQKSYIPQGPLKLAVTYPMVQDSHTDDEVKAALRAVGLEAVAARDLQQSANWSLCLSGGEQQRLALARVLLRKPSCLFLDEATSAIGQAGTLEMYKLLRSGALPQQTCVVTISHKIDLLKPLHDKTYAYNNGDWEER